MRSEEDRFFDKVKKTDNCWIWVGSKYRGGYGHFRRKINNFWKMYKAHRYSYELHKGPIPTGMLICHSCDNPACVNPNHLWAGTTLDNIKDKLHKNRQRFGVNPTNNNLSFTLAQSIRSFHISNLDVTSKEIAKRFNTSPSQICRILSNQIWRKEN